MKKLFSKFFFNFRFFSKINWISTDFFFKYKTNCQNFFLNFFRIFFSKIFFYKFFFWWKFFLSNFFRRKLFFTTIFFYKFFFGDNFFYRIFFGENFSFHKNISAKIFFTIFWRIPFVFDVCEIKYFAKFFIRNFAYCDFFRFANLMYGKKIVNFFWDFFFSDKREYQIWKCFFSEKK